MPAGTLSAAAGAGPVPPPGAKEYRKVSAAVTTLVAIIFGDPRDYER